MKSEIELERLATVGEMMGNISHQWKQPLNNISLMVLNIDNTYRKGNMTLEYMEDKVDAIEETIEYMTQTIEDFSDYLSPKRNKNNFYVNDSIEKAMELTMPTLNENAVDIILYAEDDYEYFGRKNELTQVLIILINNAKEALVKDEKNLNKQIIIEIEKEHKTLIVKVKDNGLGVPNEIKSKIFDAYFSTNENSKGRGLGLYMSKEIVEARFNGSLGVENSKGAIFTIKLPL